MQCLFNVFKWNFKRFFVTDIAEPIGSYSGACGSFCAGAISSTVAGSGKKLLVPVNVTLFLFGLILLVIDDTVQAYTTPIALRVIGISAASLFLILKFDVWRIRDARNIAKLIYIVCMSLGGAYSTMTYFFLVIYENIIAYGIWGGI